MFLVIDAIQKAFFTILTFKNLKVITISSILVILSWIGIGYLVWDYLILLASKVLEFIPFSLLKSNGAWMFSSFLWFQLVLVTFAFLYTLFGGIFINRIAKEKYGYFAFGLILISAILWAIIWYFIGDDIYNELLKIIASLPFDTLEKGLASLVAIYILYNAIIVTLVFVASMLTPYLTNTTNKLFIFLSIKYSIKNSIIFFILFFVTFGLLFIPGVNIIVQIILWIWLLKDTITYDAMLLAYKKVDKEILKDKKLAILIITFIAVLFNFLPIFNIFGPFFGEIALYYYLKEQVN